jgi:hypothetical protein
MQMSLYFSADTELERILYRVAEWKKWFQHLGLMVLKPDCRLRV